MISEKKEHPTEKTRLHPRNKHRERYNFKLLIETCPDLAQFVRLNEYQDESIDFSNPGAVKMLNKALLKYYYNIDNWNIPPGYLCPPIPGRADYIHHIADLLCRNNYGKIPEGAQIKCLDIGVGANCVYPIIGNKEYGWSFVGSDTDVVAIECANEIIAANPTLKENVNCRLQEDATHIFDGIIHKDELFDLSVCTPPFHASLAETQAGTLRKLKNLNKKQVNTVSLNFGGNNNELWYPGGEVQFVYNMIQQSKLFADSCLWFSVLISKQSRLKKIYFELNQAKAVKIETVPMGQGNKTSRIVAWTFQSKESQKKWKSTRWKKVL